MVNFTGDLKSFTHWALRHGPSIAARWPAKKSGDRAALLYLDNSEESKARAPENQDFVRSQGLLVPTVARRIYVSAHYDMTREVLSSNDFRSVDFKETYSEGPLRALFQWSTQREFVNILLPPSMLVTEPPDHTRYRRLVSRAFTVRAVEHMRVKITETAQQLIEGLQKENLSLSVDLVARYCGLLPVTVIAELLGIPSHERTWLRDLGDAMAPTLDSGLAWSTHRRAERAIIEFDAWLDNHVARLRANPGDDLLSQLATLSDGAESLDEVEIKAIAGLLLVAGFETTVNLLSNGIKLLLDHPDQLVLLREKSGLWSNAVDEILRYDPAVTAIGRVSLRDTQAMGVHVPASTLVILSGGNRDPKVFTNPHVFDITRVNAKDHLTFGGGRHFCLGAALARMEGEIGLRTLFENFPAIALAPGAERASGNILRGWAQLPTILGESA